MHGHQTPDSHLERPSRTIQNLQPETKDKAEKQSKKHSIPTPSRPLKPNSSRADRKEETKIPEKNPVIEIG
jgi:hypothetical protein